MKKKFNLDIDNIDAERIEDIESFLRNEIYSTINIPKYTNTSYRLSIIIIKFQTES